MVPWVGRRFIDYNSSAQRALSLEKMEFVKDFAGYLRQVSP